MTAAANADPTQVRWRAWLGGVGVGVRPERPVASSDRVDAESDAPTELFVRQIFARADLEERRSIDLLLVALLERVPRTDGGPVRVEVVVVGPDTLRAQIVAGPAGFTLTELRLAPVVPRLLTVSMALIRVARTGRSRDVLASIEALGRILDYDRDPDGSAAVAHALVRRLEVLTSGPGVQVSVAGFLRRPADPNAPESQYLLADAALGLDDEVELRDGRLTIVTAALAGGVTFAETQAEGGAATPRQPPAARDRKPWTGGDYILLRVGRPAHRQASEARPLWQRRQEHALTDVGLGTETTQQADSYSSRAAAVLQAGRAQHIVEQALARNQASAVEALSSALTQPGAEGPLIESLAAGITAEAEYWTLAPVLAEVRNNAVSDPDRAHVVALVEARIGLRFDQLLGLGSSEGLDLTVPVTTPIVLELSEALVPIVDSAADGGHFLYELVPEMRDRVSNATGISIPGVRARGNFNLAPGGFAIQVDEVPVVEAVMRLDGHYTVRSLAAKALPADADIADVHPVTGEPGRWCIDPVDDVAEPSVADGTFSRPQYLVHRLERVIRASLGSLVGIQEVDALLAQWQEVDAQAVSRTLIGPSANQRLTVLLQDLAAEGVPIADWRAVLDAVADAGGIDTDIRALHRAVRLRLRHALPGPRTGPAALRVPAELQVALSAAEPAQFATETPTFANAQIEFLTWLRQSVETLGPVLSVITDDAVRPKVAALARTEHLAVSTLSEEEVAAR